MKRFDQFKNSISVWRHISIEMAIISSHIDYSLILSGFKRVIYQNMCYLYVCASELLKMYHFDLTLNKCYSKISGLMVSQFNMAIIDPSTWWLWSWILFIKLPRNVWYYHAFNKQIMTNIIIVLFGLPSEQSQSLAQFATWSGNNHNLFFRISIY